MIEKISILGNLSSDSIKETITSVAECSASGAHSTSSPAAQGSTSSSLLNPEVIDINSTGIPNETKNIESGNTLDPARESSMQSLTDRNNAVNEKLVKDADNLNLNKTGADEVDGTGASTLSSQLCLSISSGSTIASISSRSASPWTDEELPDILPSATKPMDVTDIANFDKAEYPVSENQSTLTNQTRLNDQLTSFQIETDKTMAAQNFKGYNLSCDSQLKKGLDDDLPEILPPHHKTTMLTSLSDKNNNSSTSSVTCKNILNISDITTSSNNNKETFTSLLSKTESSLAETNGVSQPPVLGKSQSPNSQLPVNVRKYSPAIVRNTTAAIVRNNPGPAFVTANIPLKSVKTDSTTVIMNNNPTAGKTETPDVIKRKSHCTIGIDYSLLERHSHGLDRNAFPIAQKPSTPYKVDLTKKTLAKREINASTTPTTKFLDSAEKLRSQLRSLDDQIKQSSYGSNSGTKVTLYDSKQAASSSSICLTGQMGTGLVTSNIGTQVANIGFGSHRSAPSATVTSSAHSRSNKVSMYEPVTQNNQPAGVQTQMNLPKTAQQGLLYNILFVSLQDIAAIYTHWW